MGNVSIYTGQNREVPIPWYAASKNICSYSMQTFLEVITC